MWVSLLANHKCLENIACRLFELFWIRYPQAAKQCICRNIAIRAKLSDKTDTEYFNSMCNTLPGNTQPGALDCKAIARLYRDAKCEGTPSIQVGIKCDEVKDFFMRAQTDATMRACVCEAIDENITWIKKTCKLPIPDLPKPGSQEYDCKSAIDHVIRECSDSDICRILNAKSISAEYVLKECYGYDVCEYAMGVMYEERCKPKICDLLKGMYILYGDHEKGFTQYVNALCTEAPEPGRPETVNCDALVNMLLGRKDCLTQINLCKILKGIKLSAVIGCFPDEYLSGMQCTDVARIARKNINCFCENNNALLKTLTALCGTPHVKVEEYDEECDSINNALNVLASADVARVCTCLSRNTTHKNTINKINEQCVGTGYKPVVDCNSVIAAIDSYTGLNVDENCLSGILRVVIPMSINRPGGFLCNFLKDNFNDFFTSCFCKEKGCEECVQIVCQTIVTGNRDCIAKLVACICANFEKFDPATKDSLRRCICGKAAQSPSTPDPRPSVPPPSCREMVSAICGLINSGAASVDCIADLVDCICANGNILRRIQAKKCIQPIADATSIVNPGIISCDDAIAAEVIKAIHTYVTKSAWTGGGMFDKFDKFDFRRSNQHQVQPMSVIEFSKTFDQADSSFARIKMELPDSDESKVQAVLNKISSQGYQLLTSDSQIQCTQKMAYRKRCLISDWW